jgi:hypothetical protein
MGGSRSRWTVLVFVDGVSPYPPILPCSLSWKVLAKKLMSSSTRPHILVFLDSRSSLVTLTSPFSLLTLFSRVIHISP